MKESEQKDREIDNKAYGDVIKDRGIMELTNDEKTQEKGGTLPTRKKVGDVVYNLVKTADGSRSVWAQEVDENMRWKAEMAKAAAAGKALDREGFEKHMAEVNKEKMSLVNELRSYLGADAGVYDLETQAGVKLAGENLDKLKNIAAENAGNIKIVIQRLRDIDDEFARLKQANVLSLLGYPPNVQLSAFTKDSNSEGKKRVLGIDSDNVDFYNNISK
jgi:hypothetical protein